MVKTLIKILFIIGLLISEAKSMDNTAYIINDIESITKYIKQLSIVDAHIRVCNYNKKLCKTSGRLLKYFDKHIHRMYAAVLLHESGNGKYRQGLYYKHDYGLPQINTKIWTKIKLEKLGYKIKTLKELKHNDYLAIDIGFTIFWYNIVVSYHNGKRYNAILKYAVAYHSPYKFKKVYYKKIKKIFYKLRKVNY